MKKKFLIIIVGIAALIGVMFLVISFIKNVNEDKKVRKENIIIINESYNNIKNEVEDYNNIRVEVLEFINNFYYDKIENEYNDNLDLLNDYDKIVNDITKEVEVLDSKCNLIYNDTDVNNICNNYKKDYETILNVFNDDINSYNNKLNSYNSYSGKNLSIFKSSYLTNKDVH